MSCACMDGAELCIVTSLVLLCMGRVCRSRGVRVVLWHDKYGWPSWRVFFVMINVCCDVGDMSVFGAARSGRGLGGGA